MSGTSQTTAEVVVKGNTEGASKSLKTLEGAAGGAKKAIDAAGGAGEDFGQKLDRIDKRMSGFASGIGKVTGLLGAGGLVSMASSAAQALGEMADRAQQITIANQALAISISGARQATMGLVSDYDLTVAANKAVQLGVVKTDAQFAKLAATAAKLGQSMGQSAGQSVDDLTTALGRQSVMILDNLGISLKLEDAYSEYAATIGKSAASLDDAEKKQAFLTVALSRAEAAAEKANISLDTHAQRVAVVSTAWSNFTDDVAVGVTGALAAILSPTAALTGELQRMQKAMGDSATTGEALEKGLVRIIDKTDGAANAMARWVSETTLAEDAMGRVATIAIGERNLDLARDAYLARRKETEEARKTMALEIQKRGIQESQLELAAKKGRGKGTEQKHIASTSETGGRGANDIFGIEQSNQITDSISIEASNEAMARELQLREDRIALIEHEQELVSMQIEAGLVDGDQAEELARRKFQAESDLLDFQLEAANTRAEVLDLEVARRRKASQEQQRVMLSLQQAEIKSLQTKRAQYERYGGAVGDVLGAITVAAIDNAKGQEGATARALASIATGIRNQMILTALKEFALAAASAASFNIPGAIQHATAGGLATGAAVAAGIAGAAATAAIPSAPSLSSGGGGSDSSSSSGSSRSSSKGGDGDGDGVPTSYYDGGLYSKRPERMPQGASKGSGTTVVITGNSFLGDTKEQVGKNLAKMIKDANRSLPGG